MPLSIRAQNIIMLVGSPCLIAAGFAVASGNGLAVGMAMLLLPNFFAMLFAWLLYKGLKTGVVKGRGRPTYRDKEPIYYWLNIVILTLCAAFTLAVAAFVDFQTLRFVG